MPGENDKTIDQTINFLKEIAKVSPYVPETSTNYLQALPGSPCYEYLRYKGLLGSSIDDEERYLLKVSDVNASEFSQYLNVSEDNLEAFYQSFIPLEENLLPYAIPSTSEYVSSTVIGIEESNLSGIPAKKITFALDHKNSAFDQIVISYLLTKPRSSLIHWDKVAGYTFSISFTRSNYKTQKDQIDSFIQNLVIN